MDLVRYGYVITFNPAKALLLRVNRFWLWPVLVFIALLALKYWPVFIGKVPLPMDPIFTFPAWESMVGGAPPAHRHAEMGDLVTQFYPWRSFAASVVHEGELPLWNPHIFSGAPFLANAQSALAYPPNFVYYLFPVKTAWALGFLIREALAFWFAVLFCRGLGSSRVGAVSAGLIFSGCGFMVGWNGWPMYDSALWLPLMCYAVDRLRRTVSFVTVAFCAITFAIPVLAGQPEVALYVCLAASLYGVYRLFLPLGDKSFPVARQIHFVAGFTAMAVLAVWLAAVQLLPTLEWVAELKREIGAHISWGGRPKRQMVALFSRDANANPNSARVPIPEGASYAGMLTLFAAALSAFHFRRRDVLFFALLLLAALDVAYAIGPFYRLANIVPVLRSLPNWRLLLLVDFSLAVLAALGITAVQERLAATSLDSERLRWWLVLGSVLSLIVVVTLTMPWPGARRLTHLLRSPSSSLFFAVCGFAVLAPIGLSIRNRSIAIVTLLFVDLGSYAYRHIPFFSKDLIFPEPKIYSVLKSHPEVVRLASVDGSSPSNVETVFGLESAPGYDFPTRRPAAFLEVLSASDPPTSLSSEKLVADRSRILDMLNVKYLIASTHNKSFARLQSRPDRFQLVYSDRSAHIFENLSVLPRAWFIPQSGIRTLKNDADALARVRSPEFNPLQDALASVTPVDLRSETIVRAKTTNRVLNVRTSPNRVLVKVDVTSPALLVVSQSYYPGWHAQIDGKTATVERVNYALQGVMIPAGARLVELRYAPDSIYYGALLSACALTVVTLIFAYKGLALRAARRAGSKRSRSKRR